MGYFSALNISASGLSAQRLRLDTISQNIANANTTRTEAGTPYRRKIVLFASRDNSKPFSQYLTDANKQRLGIGGVRAVRVAEDNAPFRRVYEPGHPDADEDGYVLMPNVDITTEMVNMISATRAYEANITSINTSKDIAMKALDIGR